VVRGPTKAVRPPLRKGLQWRLISHLSLNHLSLVEGGADALREILRLYETAANPSVARQISGLTSVRSSRKMARLESEHGFVFCQGIAIDTEFDEEQFAGSGAFLLASILERFFGLYSAVNSFTQLRVSTLQRKGVVWAWPPRTGEQIVV
jgi:type VI secretion system protein ImpG